MAAQVRRAAKLAWMKPSVLLVAVMAAGLAVAGFAAAGGLQPAGQSRNLSAVAHAAIQMHRTGSGTLRIWASLNSRHVGAWEIRLRFGLSTSPGAVCSAKVAAGRYKVTLPTLRATRGQAGWTWGVDPGAPSGRWALSGRCHKAGHRGTVRIRPVVVIEGLHKKNSLMTPGSLAIFAGHPMKRLARQGPTKTRGHGSTGGDPFANYKGYCTYGAWEHAQWLGDAVWGNAIDWYAEAHGKLPEGTVPVPGAVFVWKIGYWGHVGVVTGPANSQGYFPTMEMNGGTMVDSANAITTEFNKWVAHTRHTGPDMFFIYKPGTQPGAPSSFNPSAYIGHIVKQDNGSVTSWLVINDNGPHRNWIPDQATYNCLKSQGHAGPDLLSAAELNKIPDENGVWAYCTSPPPPPPTTTSGDTSSPSVPGNLHATSATTSSISVAWNAASDNVGVAGYFVYLNSSHVSNAGSTSATIGSLSCGHTYTIGVDAYDAAGNHSATTSFSAATASCPPAPSVTLQKGAARSGCGSDCYYMAVTLNNFSSGSHSVGCYGSEPPPGLFYTYTMTGTTSSYCYYGYGGTQAWVVVDGVTSNVVNW